MWTAVRVVVVLVAVCVSLCTNNGINDPATDTEPPVITLLSHTNNQKLMDSVALIRVSVVDSSGVDTVIIKGKGATLNNGAYECAVILDSGDNTLEIIASDVYANRDTLVFHLFFVHKVFNNNYTGTLTLRITNEFPAFDESGNVSVEVDTFGLMTFGTGTIPYSGEDDNGQLKIKRVGTLTMNPNGRHTGDSANGHFAVKENTDVQENYKTWVWDGSAWQPVMDEDVTNTWNGGLVFYLAEALSGGSVDEVTTAQGSVTWTLVLAVKP